MGLLARTAYCLIVILIGFSTSYAQKGNVYEGQFVFKLIKNNPFDSIYSITSDDYGTTYVLGLIKGNKKLAKFIKNDKQFINTDLETINTVLFKEHQLLYLHDNQVKAQYNLTTESYKSLEDPYRTTYSSKKKILAPNSRYFTSDKSELTEIYSSFYDNINDHQYIVTKSSIYVERQDEIVSFHIIDTIPFNIRLAYPIDNDVLLGFRKINSLYFIQDGKYIDICRLPINKGLKERQFYHASRYKDKVYLTDNHEEVTVLSLNDLSIRPVKILGDLNKRFKNNIALRDGTQLLGSIYGDVVHYDPARDKIIHVYKSNLLNTYRFYEDENGFVWIGYSNGLAIIHLPSKKIFEAPKNVNNINLNVLQVSGFAPYKEFMLVTGYNYGIYTCNPISNIYVDGKIDWNKLDIKLSDEFITFQNMDIEHIRNFGRKLMIKTSGKIHLYENNKYQQLNAFNGFNGEMSNFFPHTFPNNDFTLPLLGGYLRVRDSLTLDADIDRFSILQLKNGEKEYPNLYAINQKRKIDIQEEYSYLSIKLLDKKFNNVVEQNLHSLNDNIPTKTFDDRIIFAEKEIKSHILSIYPYDIYVQPIAPFSLEINIEKKWYKSWWFRTLVIGGLALGLLIMIRLFQHTKIQRRKIKSLETESLRSYMNPHFISNSLNSINYYILNNDKNTASSYIVMFSKLIRRILKNSDQEFISIMEEMEALRMYIEIEQMRFIDKFSYSITIDEDINQTQEIPSFILQPIVENAIWHGLIQKTDKGTLTINVRQNQNTIITSVIDDGIGMKMSKKLKSKSVTKRKSYGMQLINKRLKILNDLYNHKHEIRIIDSSELGHSGTHVDIALTIHQKPQSNA